MIYYHTNVTFDPQLSMEKVLGSFSIFQLFKFFVYKMHFTFLLSNFILNRYEFLIFTASRIQVTRDFDKFFQFIQKLAAEKF